MRIIFLVHYFPPINSSGAKRVEALSKYLAATGHEVTVITGSKTPSDGPFTEVPPPGVEVIELDRLGRERPSMDDGSVFEPMYVGRPSWKRRVKDLVMRWMGQLPDPRLPFALSFLAPWLAPRARSALSVADVVIGSTPPWPLLLAARIVKWRFGIPCILDYRDHFSECHEMPGGRLAKSLERVVDRHLVRGADHLVTISEPMAHYYRTITNRVDVILNGYDHEVLQHARSRATGNSTGRVVIRYMGIVSPGRVPHRVLDALRQLRQIRPDRFAMLKFEYYGNAAVLEEQLAASYPELREAFTFHPAVPYLEALQKIVEADYLLFCETSSKETLSAQGILTTKLFEYLGSGRPILADISPDTLAGSLIVRSDGHHVVADRSEGFAAAFADDRFYDRRPDMLSPTIQNLSRQAQAGQYAALVARIAPTAKAA